MNGEIYEAIHLRTKESCALKVYKKSQRLKTMQDWKNLRSELALLQQMDHPHIVQVIE